MECVVRRDWPRKEAPMKVMVTGLAVLSIALLLGAGCSTAQAGRHCPKCHAPTECCTCNMAR